MEADTDEESSSTPSLNDIKNGVYLTEHLADHISAIRHHLTGAPEPPEPPYPPSFHPPTGYWTSAEKALFFRALTVYSRLRPDLIAASIGTKSTADVAVYLSLLREGATRVNNDKAGSSRSRHGATITIGRDQHPAAHEVSAELVNLEDQYATRICLAEPMHVREAESEARAEALRTAKNAMRVPRGEGGKGHARDREGQRARREEFEQLRAEREVEWAREDALARLDIVGLQVLDRMLRTDEERKVKTGSDVEGTTTTTTLHPVASSSSPAGELHATTLPRSPPPPPPVTPAPDEDGEDDASAIPSNLSPASRRLISKRLYMRRKRAEASGSIAQLDPARQKPGRKTSATSKYRQPKPHGDDNDTTDGEKNPNPKQLVRGNTRPYKVQREFERLGIGADHLCENGLGLFHLGALGRLMRLYPRLDASRPEGVVESVAMETIQTLHKLVVQFTRNLVRRSITLRELDFALRAHTKVWRLGERVVRPPHVRRALELCGGARLSVRLHFGRLLARFEEGEEDSDDEEEDEDDVPLVVRARKRKAEAITSEDDEDEDTNSDVRRHEQQQEAGLNKDAEAHEAAWHRWSSFHRAMYSPFVHAPDLITPAHPFGIYVPSTMPESRQPNHHPVHKTYQNNYDDDNDDDDEDEEEEENEEDLMPIETDDEALEIELNAESRLDAADARAAAEYEAGVWRELRRGGGASRYAGLPLRTRRPRKRRRARKEVVEAS